MLLLLDLDRFGELNQAVGRAGGDDVLRAVARAAQQGVGDRGTIARLGGDDFALWLPAVPEASGGADAEAAALQMLAAAIVEDANGPFDVDGIAVRVEVTIGAAFGPLHGRDLTTLLERADTALRAARRQDRRITCWDAHLDEVTADSLQLQGELPAAISAGQLRVHYQPLVEARGGRVRGVEALVRWQHLTRGLLGPGAFLPAAERSSVILAPTWTPRASPPTCSRWRSPRARSPRSPGARPPSSPSCGSWASAPRWTTSGPGTPASGCCRTCRSTS